MPSNSIHPHLPTYNDQNAEKEKRNRAERKSREEGIYSFSSPEKRHAKCPENRTEKRKSKVHVTCARRPTGCILENIQA